MLERIDFVMALDMAMWSYRSRIQDLMSRIDIAHERRWMDENGVVDRYSPVPFQTICDDFIDIIVQYSAGISEIIGDVDYYIGCQEEDYDHKLSIAAVEPLVDNIATYVKECDYFNVDHPDFRYFLQEFTEYCVDLAYWISRHFVFSLRQVPRVQHLMNQGTIWPFVNSMDMIRLPHRPSVLVNLWFEYDF